MSVTIDDYAHDDLQSIYDHSLRVWGDKQAYSYLQNILHCMEAIPTQPTKWKDRGSVRHGLHSIRCQKHVIFFTVALPNHHIVRVLHEAMFFNSKFFPL